MKIQIMSLSSLMGALALSPFASANEDLNLLIEQALNADKSRMQFSAQSM